MKNLDFDKVLAVLAVTVFAGCMVALTIHEINCGCS